MAITVERATAIYREFVADYPSARELKFKLYEGTLGEGYGIQDPQHPAHSARAAYWPRSADHQERGEVHGAIANAVDDADFRRSLAHEVIGHHGINTFQRAEKRAILNGLIRSQDDPGLGALWGEVRKHYGGETQEQQAEEVFALMAEHENPPAPTHAGHAQEGLSTVERLKSDPTARLTLVEAMTIVRAVSWGMHLGERRQQNFPATRQSLFQQASHTGVSDMATSSSSAGPAAGSGPTSTASPQTAGPQATDAGAQKIEIEVLGARGESLAEFGADGKAKAPRASFSKPSQAEQTDKEDSVLNRTPEQENQRRTQLPEYVEQQFFKTGKRYYSSQNNNGQHYFEDRGNRIIANRAHPADRTAQIAVDIAKAREWKAIEVTGTKEFRREAWMKASLAGMTVTGYEPSARDEAELAHKRAASPTETKEQIENAVTDKTPEQTATKQAQEAAEQAKPGESTARPETSRQNSAKTAEAAAEAATIYTLSTASAQASERRVFDKAEDALRAFLNTDAKEAPHLVESKEDGARTIGQTSLNNGIRTHVVAADFKELERDILADGQAAALKAEQLSAIKRQEAAQKAQVAMDEMERVNREAAQRFASEKVKPSAAVKEHPKLVGPYAVLGAYNAALKAQGYDEQARKSALAIMRNTLAQRIERGQYDSIKTRQVRFPQRDAQEQRTQTREQTAAETLTAM
ncbi:MAG: hypothetical protein B7X43_00145 [Thiomonas sp. 15-63-373]|jgi:hypothetical protein|nr:MAG: hypothetical protein B7X43_00145 [Thiomonas sp. 15-63-373]